MSAAPRPSVREVFGDPVLLLAFGFGSGLAPKAPGTAGSLVALPLAALAATFGRPVFLAVGLLVCVTGVWLCGSAARRLATHDHPGIVWDEFAGIFVTFCIVPPAGPWLILGFVLFRLFDVWKPWPIRELDHSIPGGLGIMLDDIAAGLFAAAALAAARALVTSV